MTTTAGTLATTCPSRLGGGRGAGAVRWRLAQSVPPLTPIQPWRVTKYTECRSGLIGQQGFPVCFAQARCPCLSALTPVQHNLGVAPLRFMLRIAAYCYKLQAGSAPGSSSSENQERIRQWLQQNSEPALPAAAAAKRRQERGASE